MVRSPLAWQLILADLALILFLLTLSALAQEESSKETSGSALDGLLGVTPPAPQFAAPQALYRPGVSEMSIAQWLAQQPPDPRATVTIVAYHAGEDEAAVWRDARRLADEAEGGQFPVRVMIARGEASAIYASLAYDAPN